MIEGDSTLKILETLIKPVIWACEKSGRVFNITGTGVDTDVYLIRYYLIQSKYLNVFIHIFLRSDRDDLHDHPWNFGTYIVRGSYREALASHGSVYNLKYTSRSTKKYRFITRKAYHLHKVELDRQYTVAEKDEAPMTICITGKTVRDWGFVKRTATGQEWVFWKKYLGLPEDAPSRG